MIQAQEEAFILADQSPLNSNLKTAGFDFFLGNFFFVALCAVKMSPMVGIAFLLFKSETNSSGWRLDMS